MTLRELLKKSGCTLKDLDKEILFSNDEELNQIHTEAQIAKIKHQGSKLIIYPLTGSEIDL